MVEDKVNGEFCEATADALAGSMLRMMDRVSDPVTRVRAAAVSRERACKYTLATQNQAVLDLYEEVARGVRKMPVRGVPGRFARTWARVAAMTRV
jgi:hypothetical protein